MIKINPENLKKRVVGRLKVGSYCLTRLEPYTNEFSLTKVVFRNKFAVVLKGQTPNCAFYLTDTKTKRDNCWCPEYKGDCEHSCCSRPGREVLVVPKLIGVMKLGI
jgi:hypothetical protein